MMKIIKDEVLKETDQTQFVETTFEDEKGEENSWSWIRRTGDKNAVIVVAIVGDKIVAQREYRVPVKKVIWQFPAGIIEKNELPEVAGARELEEETGLTIKKILRKATPTLYSSAGITNEGVNFLFVEAEGTLTIKNQENTENIKPVLLSQEDVRSLLDDLENNEMESKAYLVLDRFADTGKVIG